MKQLCRLPPASRKLSKPANPDPPALPELIENGFIRCENDILSASFPVLENAVF